MARNIGMPPKGEFPGLQRAPRMNGPKALHWVARRVAIAAGYTPKTVRLDEPDKSPELSEHCHKLQFEMVAWLADRSRPDKPFVFDGRISGYIKNYETHPDSPYHEKD